MSHSITVRDRKEVRRIREKQVAESTEKGEFYRRLAREEYVEEWTREQLELAGIAA